jgi:hypothetical protein
MIVSPAPGDTIGVRDATGICAWCGAKLLSATARFCSKKCRQTAFRLRKRAGVATSTGDDDWILPASATVGRFAYADPPYLGLAAKYYRDEPTYAGEVDHAKLIASLRTETTLNGWALSASPGSLATILPLCPRGVRVCAWVKPIGVSRKTWGAHNTWECVIVAGGRPRRPGIRDWLRAMPARGGGRLPGRKPLAFCAWLFDLLGMEPGDELLDLFPGTGVVTRAWRELSSVARPRATSLLQERRGA